MDAPDANTSHATASTRRAPTRHFARLHDFGEDATFPLADGLRRLAARLGDGPQDGKLGVVVCGRGEARGYVVDMTGGSVESCKSEEEVRDAGCVFVVWLDEELLREVLRGVRSPLDALVVGGLRFAGEEEVGEEILRRLATDPTDVLAPCREMGGLGRCR